MSQASLTSDVDFAGHPGRTMREAFADYLDRAATGRANSTSIFDRDVRPRTSADVLAGLASYVRALPENDPKLLDLARVHPDLTRPSYHPKCFAPRDSRARAMIDSVGFDRTGTATEFILRFVDLETEASTLP